MSLGPMEIGLILLAILLLFGYKKLPDASRSLGRSLRIFKGEIKSMKDDDGGKTADDGIPVSREIAAPVRATDIDARSGGSPRRHDGALSTGLDGAR
ncbi:TatA/E family protein of Tat protein translocase [Blastococcus colisei]|uniref:Sec-independent protein translocase protein TatA n=1 Tax=Blastococcus colisei TaxID=1564162 RepID=A0A543PJ40_9ACTN|nr:Sec-independent protein translocase subunit TatA [Blastococcus colisei]TQN44102.1 TatA/E family protein of Tat protein translocase [Blastococcus colisei]